MRISRVCLIGLLGLMIVGCGGGAEETPTPAPVGAFAQLVSVTGEVVPKRWADLSVQAGGVVNEVMVEPGDEVAAGDVLLRLEATDAELAVQQAEAALASAQAKLARLKALPRPEDVAEAEERVQAAQAAVSQAASERDQLGAGTLEADIADAEAQVAEAEAERKEAQMNYDEVHRQVENGKLDDWRETEAALRLRAAEQALESAQLELTQLQESRQSRTQEANAGVWMAAAERDVAEARMALVQAGAAAEEIALAATTVTEAKIELDAARVHLERCDLRAPFAGTVGDVEIEPGEEVVAGDVVATMGDLSELRVETTDLDEIDVARVAVGQAADVTFDAFPERVFAGRVTRINPMAEPGAGGVNYTVLIELGTLDPAIRWGMTAFVDIEAGE
jgi:multidrug efflux pump subunit AcrA (membrane-fusion protein)